MTDHERINHEFKVKPTGYTEGEWAQLTGSVKLSTRIGEMEKKGYVFDRDWESGNGKKWLRYRLINEPLELKTINNQVCFA
jgi:hypothetical protein